MKRYSRTKNSTKIFLAALVVAAIIFGLTQLLSCCGGSGDVVAKVNGKKIYKSQVEHKLSLLLGGIPDQNTNLPSVEDLPKEVVEILAKEIYFDESLAKIAQKSDATKTDEVRNRIEETKNAILRQAYMDSLIKEETTEEKISQEYSDLSSELESKKEYKISHIITKDKKQAEKIAKSLKRRRYSFGYAAKKYSLDKDSASDGGKLGYVLESNLIAEIADAIVTMKKGKISNPIETKFGWHLVRFTEVRDAKALPFEEVKENIRQKLIKDLLDRTKEEITKDLEVEVLLEEKAAEKTEESDKEKDASEAPKK